MAFQMKTLVKMAVLCMLGLAMVGCSSAGNFRTGDPEKDYLSITDFQPQFNSTGNADVDRVGSIVVIAVEDKKPELEEVVAKLWAERELNYLLDGAKADVKHQHGVAWDDATPEQQRASLAAVYASMTPEEQKNVDMFNETQGPAVQAANDDAADLVVILNKAYETVMSVIETVNARASDGLDIGDGIFALTEGKKLVDGADQIKVMWHWANGVSYFITDYTTAMDSYSELMQYNREKAME